MSTLVVTNLNDGGAGSLRSTIAASSSGDTITFDPSLAGGTLHLSMGELVVAGNVTVDGDINGDNRSDIGIDGDGASRVFHVTTGTSTFHCHSLAFAVLGNGGSTCIRCDQLNDLLSLVVDLKEEWGG